MTEDEIGVHPQRPEPASRHLHRSGEGHRSRTWRLEARTVTFNDEAADESPEADASRDAISDKNRLLISLAHHAA